MRKYTLADRLRYEFDNTMSRGTAALIGWLLAASALVIAVFAGFMALARVAPSAEEGPVSFADAAWMSLMQTLGAGDMGGDSLAFRLITLAVTLAGVFVVGMLIGVLTNGIQVKLEDLRKGRSFVIEEDHTIILGWSPQVFAIVPELLIANASRPHACIAILAQKDKVEMEDELRDRLGRTGKTRIICRTGSPMDPADVDIVNPYGARSILILAPEGSDPDSEVIKSLLAVVNGPNRRPGPYHIVAQIRDRKNLQVARLVGGNEAELVLAQDLISRITVQTCRHSGLSMVYSELLDFGGDEIYFQEEPALVGKSFGDALLAYEDSTIIGLYTKGGQVRLNPPMETRLEPGDQVIAISEDDDTVRISGLEQYPLDSGALREARPHAPKPARTLILGWNQCTPMIIRELDHYMAPGSEVTVVADTEAANEQALQHLGKLQHQTVAFDHGDTTDRHVLDGLDVPSYHHVIVQGYSDTMGPAEADARTLITLLHLRDIVDQAGAEASIVSQMLDARNRDLAEVTRADDFIVSDRLASLMMAQLSENAHLTAVFADLFDPQGSELYLKPAGDYVEPGRPVTFYTVVEAARRRGEVAIGYRLAAEAKDAARAYGVHTNPDKSLPVAFGEGDRIIVLAES